MINTPNRYDSYTPAARPHDFERCNACRYPFAKLEAIIDMKDFHQHKEHCPKALKLPSLVQVSA